MGLGPTYNPFPNSQGFNGSQAGPPMYPGGSSSTGGIDNSNPQARITNTIGQERDRYQNQQGPLAAATMYNYGRASESDYGNYTDLMNFYRDIYSGGGASSGGGGGGGGYDVFDATGMYTPFHAGYSDPFNSYAGFQDFSKTGGYSAADIANMRARGVAPIRSAYANARSELSRQRSLGGGYSPNTPAVLAKMAREQGQSGADTITNVEAGLAQARNTGKLAGLTGMSGIEGQRLAADVDLSKFNAGQDTTAQQRNIAAAQQATADRNAAAARAAAASSASAAATMNDRFRAAAGAQGLYGTTPAASALFGNQAIQTVGQGGQMGLGYINADILANQQPGQFDQTMNRINQIGGLVSAGAGALYPWLSNRGNNNQNPQARDTGGFVPQGPPLPPDYYSNPAYQNPTYTGGYDPYYGGGQNA